MTTPISTIQSWPLEQLQSAFTQREVQLHKALEEVGELKAQLTEMERQRDNFRGQVRISDEAFNFQLKRANCLMEKLNQYEEALQRNRSPEWEREFNELADRLILITHVGPPTAQHDLEEAAHQLRYIATSFTLKANFVPYNLKIREWWYRLGKPNDTGFTAIRPEMESFMREHNIPLERPQ